MIKPDFTKNYERAIEIPLLESYCLMQKAAGKTRVFDIGGAESLYLGWLLNNGFSVTVLDPCRWKDNQEYLKYLNHPNFSVIKTGIENFEINNKQCDFALLISVLEHLGRGGYLSDHFSNSEIKCFNNIQVPFCFTTPCGLDHYMGYDRNFSQPTLRNLLSLSNKKILTEEYYLAPRWQKVEFDACKNYSYGEIMGNGASAIGYFEIL